MKTNRTINAAGFGLVALVSSSLAGPLNPPVGPVGPTPGPEPRIPINAVNTPGDSDSLYRISQPGSYYLTGTLVGVAGKHGIEIASSDVTLDLSGFRVAGPQNPAVHGIHVSVAVDRLAIHRGTIYRWSTGINAGNAAHALVSDVRVWACSADGLSLGEKSVVSECFMFNNSGAGAILGSQSRVADCILRRNTGPGLSAQTGASIARCIASFNGADGFNLGSSSTISCCNAVYNSDDGIDAGNGTSVSDCTASGNGNDGIEVTSDSRVERNTCNANGALTADGGGIHAIGSDNRIDSNTCRAGDFGILADSSGNFIVRNVVAHPNTPSAFSYTGAQTAGPNFVSGTISGSANPWANFDVQH